MSLMVACADADFERQRALIEALSRKVFRISRAAGRRRPHQAREQSAGRHQLGRRSRSDGHGPAPGPGPGSTLDVIEQSSGQSWIGSDRMRRAIAGDYEPRAHVSCCKRTRGWRWRLRGRGLHGPLGPAARDVRPGGRGGPGRSRRCGAVQLLLASAAARAQLGLCASYTADAGPNRDRARLEWSDDLPRTHHRAPRHGAAASCSNRSASTKRTCRARWPKSRRTRWTTPTSTSSTPAAKAGAWKRASSRPAASASTRASACAPSAARRRPSPIPTTSPRPRCSTRRAPCARIAAGGRQAAGSRSPARKIAGSRSLYNGIDPIATLDSTAKVKLLERVEKLARSKDPRVAQVMAGLASEYDVVLVARADGTLAADVRPLVRLSVTVIAEQNGRREMGSGGGGGRFGLAYFDDERIDELRRRRGEGGAHQPRIASGAGRRDDGGARPGLARHPAARGDRPRAGRRLQPQGLERLLAAASASAWPPRA